MKTIYKYPLEAIDYQEIEMPASAEILTVQTQRGTPCIWALVDTDNDPEERHIRILGTGHPVRSTKDKFRRYIGTFQLMAGNLVYHVFEIE